MKLKEVLDKTTAFFKDKQIDSPRLDAELLLAHGLKMDRIQLYLKFDQPLAEAELVVLRDLVKRRVQGEPVAYILGYRDFFGYRFEVTPDTLIPRPETEHIIEEVLAWADDKEKSYGILDLGTGTGCVGLSLLKHLPNAKLLSVDQSEKALAVAQRNAESLGVSDRVRFLHGDAGDADFVMKAFTDVTGHPSIDVLVSNPPYIAEGDPMVEENVRKYEPHMALYAEDDGRAFLKKWSSVYCPYLNPISICLMEMGLAQGSAMKEHFHGLGAFQEVCVIKDLSGHDRIICGVKNG